MKALFTATIALLAAGITGCGDSPTSEVEVAERVTPAKTPKKNKKRAKGGRRQFNYDSVETNKDVEVPTGFRGDLHPLLEPETRLEVAARWSPSLKDVFRDGIKLGKVDNASVPEYSIPEGLVELLTESSAAQERASHGASAWSVFLPEEVEGVGQMWTISPEATVPFLRQFHPQVSTTFDRYKQPYGRRPGPAGAFGILRAVSDEHLDVLFRLHAEFSLQDGVAVYTPACFLGRLLIDRRTGAVDSFRMHVPTDRAVNVNITLTFRHPKQPGKEVTNIVFELVDPMELRGGDEARYAAIAWDEEIELEEAHHRLKNAFYKFMDIEWVQPEDMLEVAEEAQKPIMLVVLTSPLDDQSC